MSNTKPKCQTCGRKIPTSGSRLSSIGFRRRVNGINTLDDLINSKEYLAQFVKSRFYLKEYVDKFLAELEEGIDPTVRQSEQSKARSRAGQYLGQRFDLSIVNLDYRA